jgi:hypothetical protein
VDLNRAYGPLTEQTSKDIDAVFEYQPWNEEQIAAGKKVREALAAAFKAIVQHVPPGPDRSVALRKLREARMDANSALTFGGRL